MAPALALGLYRALTRRGLRYAERTLARRLKSEKEDRLRINERRGIAGVERPAGDLIWFHAASVGEALSILELIRRLGEEDEAISFMVTTGTVTSARILERRLPATAIHQYIPIDIRPFVTRFLDHWRPDLAVWTESEFWPNLMCETHAREIPMVLINGRMSSRSHRVWRWLRGSSRHLLGLFAMAHVQDTQSGNFLKDLGLPEDRMTVTGTLKEGSAALPCDEAERTRMTGLIGNRPTWLAASTHPGEDEIVLEAHERVLRRSPRNLLILVPRHPERGEELDTMISNKGWRIARRSNNDPLDPETQIYIADTLGELGLWYRIAPISFVGGSLVQIGGHNPFEPAALGSAILHGPHVTNFMEIYDRLANANAARLVRSGPDLFNAIATLLAPHKAAAMAHAAWDVCSSGAEVTDQAKDMLLSQLYREG
ncbi:MAG: 3-deoxy-D-manno-octulosonic acid transferase [Pseudomonadota bacterium]